MNLSKYSKEKIQENLRNLRNLVASNKKCIMMLNAKGRKRDIRLGIFPPLKYLKEFVEDMTPLLKDPIYHLKTKVYWLVNNISGWDDPKVRCKKCGKPFKNKNVINVYVGYHDFCSLSCAANSTLVQEKIKNTSIQHWGTEHYMKSKAGQDIISNAKLANHGDANYNNVKKAKQTRLDKNNGKYHAVDFVQKTKTTKLKNHGDPNYNNSKKKVETRLAKNNGIYETSAIKAKKQQTYLKHYGVKHDFQSKIVQEKCKKTLFEKFNVTHISQSQYFKKTFRATCLQKYGVDHPSQCPEIQQKMHFKYFYDNKFFDSSPEIAFYIWLKDNNKDFEYQPKVDLWYEFEGKQHNYCPDFLVDGQLVELKGDQFLKEDGTWQNPYDHLKDALYEAKRQCCIANNVKVLYSADYQKYIEYVYQRYGKEFLMKFKHSVNKIDNEIH